MMESGALMMSLLTSVGVRMPVLIALGVALVMLGDAPAGRVRRVARTALALLMGATLVDGLLSVLPLLLLLAGDFSSIGRLGDGLGVARFATALVQAGSFIALAWALVQGLRGRQQAG